MIEDIAQIVILIVMICMGYLAIKFKDLLASVIALSVMSLLLSLEFYILQAPDVAIAEAGIGAGLTTAIFILAIKGTNRMDTEDEQNE